MITYFDYVWTCFGNKALRGWMLSPIWIRFHQQASASKWHISVLIELVAAVNICGHPRLLWKWMGGSRSHSECFFVGKSSRNSPKPVLIFWSTVEPLSTDHPYQRPSLSYDHISCDGQCFLFVYESLTSDHPYYTTTPMWFWGWSYKRGSTVVCVFCLYIHC